MLFQATIELMSVDFDFFGTTAKRIRLLREDRDIKQKDMAEKLGKSRSFMSEVESGKKNLTIQDIAEIARVLGTTTDYLLLLTDDPNPPNSSSEYVSLEVRSPVERELLEDWADTIQDMSHDQRRSLLETVRLLIGPTKPRIIGE